MRAAIAPIGAGSPRRAFITGHSPARLLNDPDAAFEIAAERSSSGPARDLLGHHGQRAQDMAVIVAFESEAPPRPDKRSSRGRGRDDGDLDPLHLIERKPLRGTCYGAVEQGRELADVDVIARFQGTLIGGLARVL